MAEHVWTVLCRKGCQDKETNVITLVEVIERISAQLAPGFEKELGSGRPLLPIQAEIVSWWIRSVDDQEEEAAGRLLMVAPGDEEISTLEFPIDLTGKHIGRRTIAKLPGVPADKGSGLFWFVMQIKDGEEEWRTVTRIPLRVEISAPAEPEG